MEDDDIDMPYAPPVQNANTSRCPNNEASRNGMQPPSTRYPPLMNPWAGYQTGYNMNSTLYGTSNYPSTPYSDGSPNYSSPSYAAHWSQNSRAQGIPYHDFTDFQHHNSEPPLSRSYPTLPPMSGPPEYNSWTGPWPHNSRAMPMFANENSIAGNNSASQRLGNDGVSGASQEQGNLQLQLPHSSIERYFGLSTWNQSFLESYKITKKLTTVK